MKKNIEKILVFVFALIFCYITEIGCLFYKITGFYCPGCGLTRCVKALLKLEFYQAFRYNPLIIVLGFLFLIYSIICLFLKKQIHISNKACYLLVLIVIVYGFCRNIDNFSWLAPTKIY